MTNMAAMPIYDKNLKNLLLQNQLTDDLENLVCSIMYRSTTKIFKLLPWVNLDIFYAKVKFGHIGFCMDKSEKYILFETVTAIGL